MSGLDLRKQFLTAGQLVDSAPLLGLPHFQRGSVWSDWHVSRLLESLMLDTPCGTIILWVPKRLTSRFSSLGLLPWCGEREREPSALVIDGQQRITALCEAWDKHEGWAFNPAAIPELAAGMTGSIEDLKKAPLFRRLNVLRPETLDMSAGAKSAREKKNNENQRMVPLHRLFDEEDFDALWRQMPVKGEPPPRWKVLAQGIHGIPSRRFHVVVKRERVGRHDLLEMVELYNRINSSGAVVEDEERAFAAMVAIKKDTPNWLATLYASVHGTNESELPSAAEHRNKLLKREREKMFGFKLFVHTFVRAVAYHKSAPDPKLNVLEDSNWRDVLLGQTNRKALDGMSNDCSKAITTVASVLKEDLGCDDFRFLPSAEGLAPVLTLMFAYPEMDRRIVAWLILRGQARRGANVVVLRDVLRTAQGLVETIDHADFEKVLPKLRNLQELTHRLEEAKTLQDRHVNLLYWLLRRRKAGDLTGTRLLCKESEAQKQHVVPYAKLKEAFDLGTRRPDTHLVHSIGNLTLIEGDINWELSDNVDYVKKMTEKDRKAHFLDGKVYEEWEKVAALLEDSGKDKSEAIKEAFEAFTKARVQAIAAGFSEWFEKIHSEAREALDSENCGGLKPKPALLDEGVQKIWEEAKSGNWSEELKEAMLRLARQSKKLVAKGSKPPYLVLDGNLSGKVELRIRLWIRTRNTSVGKEAPKAKEVRRKLEAFELSAERRDWKDGKGTSFQVEKKDEKSQARIVNALCEALTEKGDKKGDAV